MVWEADSLKKKKQPALQSVKPPEISRSVPLNFGLNMSSKLVSDNIKPVKLSGVVGANNIGNCYIPGRIVSGLVSSNSNYPGVSGIVGTKGVRSGLVKGPPVSGMVSSNSAFTRSANVVKERSIQKIHDVLPSYPSKTTSTLTTTSRDLIGNERKRLRSDTAKEVAEVSEDSVISYKQLYEICEDIPKTLNKMKKRLQELEQSIVQQQVIAVEVGDHISYVQKVYETTRGILKRWEVEGNVKKSFISMTQDQLQSDDSDTSSLSDDSADINTDDEGKYLEDDDGHEYQDDTQEGFEDDF